MKYSKYCVYLKCNMNPYSGYTRIICNQETYIQQFALQQIFKPTICLYLSVLTHYIILVTYLSINFHVFIIQQSMSEMRLRHKKPINSYVGQGNYDSNQVHDEDFAKNAMQNKKVRLMKQRPSNEQTKKYAEILCQFVSVVNQDYRNHSTLFTVPKQVPEKELDKLEAIDNLAANKSIKDNCYVKSQEVVSKQQQKIRKSENNINKLSLTKKIRKEKIFVQEQPKIKEIRENQNKIVTTINFETKPPLPINSKQPGNAQREKIQPPPSSTTNLNPNQSQNNLPSIEQIQQLQQMQHQQLFQTQLMAMNSGLYPMYPYPMSQYINYQMFMEQLKTNPYLSFQNIVGMLSPGMTNNYIPFSKLPFPRNAQPDQKKQDTNASLKNENKLQNPLNNMKEQHPHQNAADQQKTIQNLGNIQSQTLLQPKNSQGSIKKQSSEGTIQPIDFKRKSCYHIAIAYSIHFARLKENGLLNQAPTEQGYMKLDPTFPARRVRNRKHSDSAGR